jgi:hypothetical protein
VKSPDEPSSFDIHIRPLFREADRDEMLWAFDLFDEADVRSNADIILKRLEDGDMPCDETWSEEWVGHFRSWVVGTHDLA